MATETYYHGSGALFESFDLNHSHEGHGNSKFGFGVSVALTRAHATHYAYKVKEGEQIDRYLYTVEAVAATPDNHLGYREPIFPTIIARVEERLGYQIPDKIFDKAKKTKIIDNGGNLYNWLASTAKETGLDEVQAKKYASDLLHSVGVLFMQWPCDWRKPEKGHNRVYFSTADVRVIGRELLPAENTKTKRAAKTPRRKNADDIKDFYPQYWGIEYYPAEQCACIRAVDEQWGILGNFAQTPIIIDGVTFRNAEQLFQMMRFCVPDILLEIHNASGMTIKMKAKKHKADTRSDWGRMFIDAMRFCLNTKYQQCPDFRKALEETKAKQLLIVEDETARCKGTKQADCWGTKLEGGEYVGPNILGRLLMELRDNGHLDYTLPNDALDFIKAITK